MQMLEFKLAGLHCEACVKLSKIKLKNLPGIKEVKIDLDSGRGTLSADREITQDELSKSLAGTDYIISKIN